MKTNVLIECVMFNALASGKTFFERGKLQFSASLRKSLGIRHPDRDNPELAMQQLKAAGLSVGVNDDELAAYFAWQAEQELHRKKLLVTRPFLRAGKKYRCIKFIQGAMACDQLRIDADDLQTLTSAIVAMTSKHAVSNVIFH